MAHVPNTQIFLFDPNHADRQSLALGPFETDVLRVARYLCQTHEDPDTQCWMQAFMEAEQCFPPPFGATIAHAISIALTALQSARGGVFSYLRVSDPLADTSITQEERYFVEVLRGLRTGDVAHVRSVALLLCQGGASDAFLGAMERLCIITGDVRQPRFQY